MRALFTAWALLLGGGPLFAESYALKPEATVHGPWITAGDLLEPAAKGKLAGLRLRKLGQPGSRQVIPRDLLLVKIRDARLGVPVELSGTACAVTASKRIVPGAEIQAFAEGYLRERLAALSATAELEIRPTAPPKDAAVPDRPVRFEIPGRSGQLRGSVMLRVSLKQSAEDGSELEVGQQLLPFSVKVRQRLLAASRDIRRGELIGPDNAALSLMDASALHGGGYASLEEAQGLKARSVILAGKAIEPSLLERPAVVRRGDIVRLRVRSGLVTVEAQAKALRDGAAGDSIPVEVLDKKKQLQARVLEAGLVVSETP